MYPDLVPDSNDPNERRRLLAMTGGMTAIPTSQPVSTPISPAQQKLKPITTDAIPASDATRLQPVTPKTALPTEDPKAAIGGSSDLQGRLQHLRDMDANPWGSENNHPGFGGKLAHVAAKVGNIAGDIIAPNVMARIPGTELNRKTQEEQLQGQIGQAQTRETAAATEKTREKHEENVEDTNQQRLDQAERRIDETENKDKSAREIALRKQGLKIDEHGAAVPLQYEDMSPTEQAVHDLKVAQADSQTAKAALDQIKSDPNSPQNKAILERIRVMAKNASTAAGKLGLDEKKFTADYFGLGPDGNPLPGSPTTPEGKPIGPRVAHAAAANLPGAERLKRADLAENVLQNTGELRKMIRDNPDLFGKISGRFTSISQMMGSDDPAIVKIGVAVHNVALASNGAHGLRSAEAVKETEDRLLNHFRNGVDATVAGFDEIDHSVGSFIEAAKKGKHAMSEETPKGGGEVKPPKEADPGMKWQHRTGPTGQIEWRQTKAQ